MATPGPECEQPILATFHRKSDLRDRTGRKQTLSPLLVLNSELSMPHQEDSPITREQGLPANSEADSSHQLEEDPEDNFAQAPAVLSLSPPHLDINQASNWPGLQTLLQQLPPQDSDERYCLALGEEERAELRFFCAQRKQKALGQGVARLLPPMLEGHTCEKCREQLKPGEYGVFADRAGRQRCWHPPCFACQTCGQALINLIYFYHDGHLYCGRHHAELLRPRCPACDQLIFSQHCTEAEGQRWHENHFCCQGCAGPLGGGSYALPGGSPCCPSCFESRYSDADTSPAGALEGRVSLGKRGEGPDGTGTHGRASSEDATVSRAALPASRRRDTRGVREQGPAEDAPCPTCSSSSDSEPEGFFLGQRLPGPGPAPGRLRAEDGDPFRKRCTVC
ncbi:prickle-like protein 4 isoform X1 [Dipodomys spectabilis]|uniref:prickle-like protein 4 isoform X1 n=1 Tax=Dipodomys spectabilis TaxID=105255 RepID=UPI001C54B65B|nr:prickle-like protein 4 isoform X1 [Dipodomys spectabilis]